jgi:hypothetical protein
MKSKKILSIFLAFALVISLMPGLALQTKALDVYDYSITNGTSGFLVNGGGDGDGHDYGTLAAALGACTNSGGDGKLVIRFGDGSSALTVNEKVDTDTSQQALISATYIGSIQINRDLSIPNDSQTYGVCIPAGVSADFRNLSAEDSGTSDRAELAASYVSGGSLTVNSGTSITVNGSGNYSILADSGSVIS